jgi:hypothetical protein
MLHQTLPVNSSLPEPQNLVVIDAHSQLSESYLEKTKQTPLSMADQRRFVAAEM